MVENKANRNPFHYLLPVPPKQFVGRWTEIKRIALDLMLDQGDSWAVIAGRRFGKSSLIFAVEHQLRLNNSQNIGDWHVIPILFDFKSQPFSSAGEFFAHIFIRIRSAFNMEMGVDIGNDDLYEVTQRRELTLREFEDSISHILNKFESKTLNTRFVLLLDEIDETLGNIWTNDLFNQLRSMVYFGTLKSRLRLLLTGSRRFFDQVSKRGSPLWNILKLKYLEPFDRRGFDELVERVPELNKDIISIIFQLSGGHPFIAQYLLHHLWDENFEISRATQSQVENLAGKFISEQIQDIEGWAQGIDIAGFHAYGTLLLATDWIEEQEIFRKINNPDLNIKRGLLALCYHGLAIHDDGWSHYKRAGDIFKSWFINYGAAFLASRRVAEPIISQIVQVSGGTVIFSASAQVKQDQLIHAERIAQMTYQEKVISIGNNNTITAPLVIAENIENSFNALKDAQVSEETRKLLEELLKTINDLYAKIPADKSSEVESMARDAETLVKEVSSSKPRRKWYEVSFDGLKQAATNIGELANPVMNIVSKLILLL